MNSVGDTGTGDQDDEDKDTIGETRFMKPIKATRSSTLLHSVEDLSTDSSCLFRARSGFDSNRSSSRRRAAANATDGNTNVPTTKNGSGLCCDELADKVPLNINHSTRNYYSAKQASAYRGLSRSMILPTPASDLSDFGDTIKVEKQKSCCDKIKRFATNYREFEHGINLDERFLFFLLCTTTNTHYYIHLYCLYIPYYNIFSHIHCI